MAVVDGDVVTGAGAWWPGRCLGRAASCRGGGMTTCWTAAAAVGFPAPSDRVTTTAMAVAISTVAIAATRPGLFLQPFPALSVGVGVTGSTGRNRMARKACSGRP